MFWNWQWRFSSLYLCPAENYIRNSSCDIDCECEWLLQRLCRDKKVLGYWLHWPYFGGKEQRSSLTVINSEILPNCNVSDCGDHVLQRSDHLPPTIPLVQVQGIQANGEQEIRIGTRDDKSSPCGQPVQSPYGTIKEWMHLAIDYTVGLLLLLLLVCY